MTDIKNRIKQAERIIKQAGATYKEACDSPDNKEHFVGGSDSIIVLNKHDDRLVAARIKDDKGVFSYGTFNNEGKIESMCVCEYTDDQDKQLIASTDAKNNDEAIKLIKDKKNIAYDAQNVPCKCKEVMQFQEKAIDLTHQLLLTRANSRQR